MANHNTRKQRNEPMKTRSNNTNRRQARENACDQATIGFDFASDWLRKWREFFKPITERSKAKPKQFSDYFRHLKLKLALKVYIHWDDTFIELVTLQRWKPSTLVTTNPLCWVQHLCSIDIDWLFFTKHKNVNKMQMDRIPHTVTAAVILVSFAAVIYVIITQCFAWRCVMLRSVTWGPK